jgi:putative ABC transport system permease protein
MGTVTRGTKNAFRNTIRTVSIVLILGISFALALVMILSLQAVRQRINAVSTTSGNTISVTPAGFGGFGFGGGNPLTAANIATIEATPHVVSVTQSVTGRLTNPSTTSSGGFFGGGPGGSTSSNSTTNLTSPVAGGTLGGAFGGGSSTTVFVPPIRVVGTNEPLDPSVLGASSVTLVSGKTIDGNSSDLDALVGTSLAAKNNLKVGSTFKAYEKTFTVEGIYKTNSTFTDAGLIMPIKTVETLSGVTGPTSVTVTVDSIANVNSTAAALQSSLGTSVATVTAGTPGSQNIVSSYDSIKSISLYSLIGALIAASIILLLSMLMIVRERRREIGVLKAFGSSNGGIVGTFVTEALTLTVLGGVLGVILGALLANPVLSVLEKSTSTNTGGATFTGRFGGGPGGAPGGGFAARFGGAGFRPGAAISDLHAAVGPSIPLYGILAAVGIALIGSAVPAYLIAKVRPAEVMRSE